LAALLHAAALGGFSMLDVLDWVSRPDAARDQLTSVLRRSPESGFVEEVGQFLATNDRTRTSITSTIMPTLGWLTSSAAVHAATGGYAFDVAELLTSRATVYLLGAEETHTAPLVCALTGHIAREARRIAASQPSGRIDPPLTLALDEAALISPVPLDRWSADMGGRGVCIVAAFQSRSQLIDRYGEARAATTINNAGAKVIFGGTGDRDDLNYWSTLAGERDEPVTTTDLHGQVLSRTVRRVPVLAPAQLSQLPPHRVVVFTASMPPVVGRADLAWQRPDVRAVLQPASVSVRFRATVSGTNATLRSWLLAPVRLMAAVSRRAWRSLSPTATRTPGVGHTTPIWTDAPSVPWAAEVIPFPTPAVSDDDGAATPFSEWPPHSGPDRQRGRGRWN
jgi:type IV secretory pathway TraG/TraD family ATPase VirD4